MRPILITLLAVLLATGAAAKSKSPIQLALGAEPAQQVMTHIAARALVKAGFKVELVSLPRAGLAAALISGEIDAHVDAVMVPALSDAVGAEEIRSLGGRADNARDAARQKLVWTGMKRRWPDAQKLLKRMVLPDAVLEALAGDDPEAAADTWWVDNRKTWQPWIAASRNWMKP